MINLCKPPRIVFFDAGLVLLHPSGERLYHIVERTTGLRVAPGKLVDAYRHAIYERDCGNQGINDFPFWDVWCWWAGVPVEHASVLQAQVSAAETDGEKLWTVPDMDAAGTLVALSRLGVRLAVISNADGELESDLSRVGFGGYFDLCFDSVKVGLAKPDPAFFRYALSRTGQLGQDAWMVGDDYLNDIAPALHAGFAAMFLFDPSHLRQAASTAHLIRRLNELAQLVQRLRCSDK